MCVCVYVCLITKFIHFKTILLHPQIEAVLGGFESKTAVLRGFDVVVSVVPL